MIYIQIIAVILLILLTAFFVATEFAIVKVRITRIETLIEQGDQRAVSVRKILQNLDGYLSACQLGITVTALGLGWLGEPTVERMLRPAFQYFHISEAITAILSFALAFFVITFLHVVVGELAPKTIAIQKAEKVALFLANPLILVYRVLYPFVWILNGSARLFIRLFGIQPTQTHDVALSEEEIRLTLSESYKSGEINQLEMMYVNNVFEFDDRIAKEIMIPRTEMVCIFIDESYEAMIETIQNSQFTRYPVADDDKDRIVGLINIKHIMKGFLSKEKKLLQPYVRPILHVSEVTPIKQVFNSMQKKRIHMAIVVDEYGGTAGLVTIEDILEEIVGDIKDEFDVNESPMVEHIDQQTVIVDGKLLLEDIHEMLAIPIEDTDVDTVGGWILTKQVEAKRGTMIPFEGYRFIVEEVDGYQIKKVRIVKDEL